MLRLEQTVPRELASDRVCRATHAVRPVEIDGCLDDAAWGVSPSYSLAPMIGRDGLRDGGEVRFAWDASAFYVAATLRDRDIVAHGDTDGLLHHRLGDVFEVFLKPPTRAWYCEVHLTPKGRHTVFVWPQSGTDYSRAVVPDSGVRAAAAIRGTSGGWTVELAIPVSFLESSGERFAPGRPWTVLTGRYNYDAGLTALELSSWPALPQPDFHRTEHYALLVRAAARDAF